MSMLAMKLKQAKFIAKVQVKAIAEKHVVTSFYEIVLAQNFFEGV